MIEKRTAFYDEAPYDRNYDPLTNSQKTINPHIQKLVVDHLDKIILDIGCGCGHNLFGPAQKAKLAIGMDYSELSVRIAKQRLPYPNIHLLQGDNVNLSLPNDFADFIISDGVIHHTGNTEKAFTECVRVLKPGGYFYLATYTDSSWYQWIYTYIGGFLRAIKGNPLGQMTIEHIIVPLYHLAYHIKNFQRKQKFSFSTTRGAFYDYFLSPIVTFQSKEMIEAWIQQHGCQVVFYEQVKFSHHFVIKKSEISQ